MAKYESEIKMVPHATTEQIFTVLANLERLKPIFDNIADNPLVRQKIEEAGQDPSMLDKLKDVEIDNDGITFPIPMMGKMCMQIEETEENRCVKYKALGIPLDANLWIQMLPVSSGGSKIRVTVKAEMNMMMKMMVGSKLKDGVNQFAEMIAGLPFQFM